MNIAAIQKNYNKLTPTERFSMLTAAIDRDDAQDRAALIASSPRKRWDVPTTRGLGDAFEFLSAFHVNMQLGYAGVFWYLLFCEDDETRMKYNGLDFNDAMILLQRRIITGREAWRAVCAAYGVDPGGLLLNHNFVEMIDITELMVKAANPDLEYLDLQENIESYKLAIETKRKDWE
jgi:hypothetical protein